MDRRERLNDPTETFIAGFTGMQAELWTALPGIVQSFNPAEQTCSVKPAIQARLTDPKTGVRSWIPLPILTDCPVMFPSGGGCLLTFPVAAGDECLVIFSSRCIDGWWQDGGIQRQPELRMHDLSDGFVFVGINSLKNIPPDISDTQTELRTVNNAVKIALNAVTNVVTIIAPGNVIVQGDVIADGISLKNHVHGGVSTGSSNTGVPVP